MIRCDVVRGRLQCAHSLLRCLKHCASDRRSGEAYNSVTEATKYALTPLALSTWYPNPPDVAPTSPQTHHHLGEAAALNPCVAVGMATKDDPLRLRLRWRPGGSSDRCHVIICLLSP
ncbi:unnamed protein product [Boreogadus saida]